jgi:hypothetical protein
MVACEHNTETLGVMKGGEFLDQLIDYWHIKKESSPRSKIFLLSSLMKATLLQKNNIEMHSIKVKIDLLPTEGISVPQERIQAFHHFGTGFALL